MRTKVEDTQQREVDQCNHIGIETNHQLKASGIRTQKWGSIVLELQRTITDDSLQV